MFIYVGAIDVVIYDLALHFAAARMRMRVHKRVRAYDLCKRDQPRDHVHYGDHMTDNVVLSNQNAHNYCDCQLAKQGDS